MTDSPQKNNHTVRNTVLVAGGIVLVLFMGMLSISPSDNTSTTETLPAGNTAAPAGSVDVTSSTSSPDEIVGEVLNSTDAPATFVEVTVTLYDEQGAVVGTDFTFAVSTDALGIGETAPFKILFLDPIAFSDYKLRVTWD